MPQIPRADERPTIRLWPEAGQALGLGRSATYDAAERGQIPTIRLGRRIVVPTARLRQMLGLDDARREEALVGGPPGAAA